MPAASTTARTPPPAMTPVPAAAGFINTRAALYLTSIWCGIVRPDSGTVTIDFLAASTAFRIDSGTSPALPRPTPTRPFLSPTTTMLLKLKRLPPCTTLATRLICTTCSSNSFSSPPKRREFRLSLTLAGLLLLLELQARLASCLGYGFYSTVVLIASAVEDDGGNALFARALGDRLSDQARLQRLGMLVRELFTHGRLECRRGSQRSSLGVVDQLGVNVYIATENREPRPLGGSADLGPHPQMTSLPGRQMPLVLIPHE